MLHIHQIELTMAARSLSLFPCVNVVNQNCNLPRRLKIIDCISIQLQSIVIAYCIFSTSGPFVAIKTKKKSEQVQGLCPLGAHRKHLQIEGVGVYFKFCTSSGSNFLSYLSHWSPQLSAKNKRCSRPLEYLDMYQKFTACRNLFFPHQIFMSLYWALN